MREQYISLSDLKNVKGIGDKTIERVYEYLEEQGELKRFKSVYKPEKHISEGLHQGDCLELMYGIPDKSIDMILADLPYGTTACSWDEVIPFEPLWSHYKRIIKDNGAIVLFGSEPFSTKLRMSNMGWYRYDWVWQKSKSTGFPNANKRPLKIIENIIVFCKGQSIYNPQGLLKYDEPIIKIRKAGKGETVNQGENDGSLLGKHTVTHYNFPKEVLEFKSLSKTMHPTQKPVALLEYLIKTYTNEGDLVLDNVMGSGSTGVACKNLNRRFIGMELDEKYFEIAKERIDNT